MSLLYFCRMTLLESLFYLEVLIFGEANLFLFVVLNFLDLFYTINFRNFILYTLHMPDLNRLSEPKSRYVCKIYISSAQTYDQLMFFISEIVSPNLFILVQVIEMST